MQPLKRWLQSIVEDDGWQAVMRSVRPRLTGKLNINRIEQAKPGSYFSHHCIRGKSCPVSISKSDGPPAQALSAHFYTIHASFQTNRTRIALPSAIRIFTDDIDHFWQCFQAIDDTAAGPIFYRHARADTSQLTDLDKMVRFDTALAVPLIIHEYVHFQQKNTREKSLLDYAIMEGAADFITYLVTGTYTNPEVYQYGMANEKNIWTQFKEEMNTENFDNWLFNAYNPTTGHPGNLGYFVGFRICEQCYNRRKDKRQAITDLFEIKDFARLLQTSGYDGHTKSPKL